MIQSKDVYIIKVSCNKWYQLKKQIDGTTVIGNEIRSYVLKYLENNSPVLHDSLTNTCYIRDVFLTPDEEKHYN